MTTPEDTHSDDERRPGAAPGADGVDDHRDTGDAAAQDDAAEDGALVRAMFRSILVRGALVVVALAVVGCAAGYLVSGMPGLWGALMAVALAGAYLLTTVVVMILTSHASVNTASSAIMGAWLVKVLITVGLLLVVRGRDFFDPVVFFGVIVVAVIAMCLVEVLGVMRARIPIIAAAARRR